MGLGVGLGAREIVMVVAIHNCEKHQCYQKEVHQH